MAAAYALSVERTGPAPVEVARPRRTDAIGDALRQAFRPSRAVPDQWTGALRRLDALD